MNLTQLSKTIRFDNASQGFDPTEGGIARYILLAISEVCEAQDEIRDGRRVDEIYYEEVKIGHKVIDPNVPDEGLPIYGRKPCGFPVEIADALIRLLDIAGKFDFILDELGHHDLDINIDKALLEIVNTISMISLYEAKKDSDFEEYLNLSIGQLFQLAEDYKLHIFQIIEEKLAFNRSRPPKHGRKF